MPLYDFSLFFNFNSLLDKLLIGRLFLKVIEFDFISLKISCFFSSLRILYLQFHAYFHYFYCSFEYIVFLLVHLE